MGYIQKIIIYKGYYDLDIFMYSFLEPGTWWMIAELLIWKCINTKKKNNVSAEMIIVISIIEMVGFGIISIGAIGSVLAEATIGNISRLAYVALFIIKFLIILELSKNNN